jgi:hypothetical protein
MIVKLLGMSSSDRSLYVFRCRWSGCINRWDVLINNKITWSPEEERSYRYNNQKRMTRNYEGYSSHSQVAAGYRDNNNQRDEHQSSGYRNNNRDDSGPNKPFRPRTLRDYNQSPDDILNACHMHYTYIKGKKEFGIT